ncbi:MAG: AEC family transporter [Deltaproteobacteria bacterium]|nr:AEC family transporter [Deltaproteobacteria bacterium]
MPFLEVFAIVFPVFCIIGLGYLFAAYKKFSLEPLVETLLYLTIPALVISSLIKDKILLSEFGVVSLAAFTVVLSTGLITLLFLILTGRRSLRGFYLPTMFMNSGNMAFPLSLLAFGEEGLTVAVVYYVAIGILVSTLGIYIAAERGGWPEIVKMPLLYAAAIGIGVNVTGVKVPSYLIATVDLLGSATIPLMLVSLGYRLYSIRLNTFRLSLWGSLIRIVGGGIVAYGFVTLLGIGGVQRNIIILSSTMPSAVINFVLSYRYKTDADLVASTIALSTLISVVTTPVVLTLLLYYS